MDYLEIYDGPSENSPRIGKYCGTEKPVISSTSNVLHLTMTSDAGLEFRGFNATFEKGGKLL